MRARKSLVAGLVAAVLAVSLAPEALAGKAHGRGHVAPLRGSTRLDYWTGEDWNRSAWGYEPGVFGVYPANGAGYIITDVAPYVRVGRKCVAHGFAVSVGGEYARYMRIRPAHYCD